MNLPEFSVNRKILVNMIFLILVVLGVGLYRGMPREFFPNANLNEALVMVVYPGASAREVELQITNKIEEAVAEVDGIDDVTSISQQSIAVVDLMIEEGIDQDKFMLDLQAAVNNIGDLPEDAEDPTFLQLDASVVQPVGFVAIGGDVDEAVLLEVAEDVKKEIMDVRGVKKVDVDGIRETEVHVDVDPDLLDHYHTSLGEIIAALGAHNLDLPGGYSELGKREYSLRVLGKYRTLDEISATVLRSGGPESTLRLAIVAATFALARRSGVWVATAASAAAAQTSANDRVSQNPSVPSPEPDTRHAPSGIHSTDQMNDACPRSSTTSWSAAEMPTRRPASSVFQRRSPLRAAIASRVPLGDQARS